MAVLLCNPRLKPRQGARLNPDHWAGRPTLHYLLNEGGGNLHDISGNGNTGTIASGATWSPNAAGLALKFNGTSGHVTALKSNTVQGGACWLSCYVQFNSVGGNLRRLIAGQQESGGALNCALMDYDGDLSRGLLFWVGSSTAGQNFAATPSTTWAVANKTYRLDGTWDGTTIKLYVNGALVGTGALSGGRITAANPFMLGYNPLATGTGVGGQCYLAGYISAVAAYPFAPTAAQVWQLYQNPYAMILQRPPRKGFFGSGAVVTSHGLLMRRRRAAA